MTFCYISFVKFHSDLGATTRPDHVLTSKSMFLICNSLEVYMVEIIFHMYI